MKYRLLLSALLITQLSFAQKKPVVSYATYIGGIGDDYAGFLDISNNDEIFLATGATSGAVATTGVHQTKHAGGVNDVLLQKRDKNGTLIWSTFFGGNEFDYAEGLKVLKSGKIAVVGETKSYSKIAKNGYKNSYNGGVYDGFIAVFNEDGTLDWATYYGGVKSDIIYGCIEDSDGNIYICGGTASPAGIATSGAYQSSLMGAEDGFIAKFSTSGTLLWGTYIGGQGIETLNKIKIDANGNIWVGGNSNSTSGLSTTNAYQYNISGNYDGLLMAFDKDGNLLYSTYYGGENADAFFSLDIDDNGNIYAGGVTSSLAGIATPGAIKTSFSGDQDAFVVKFNAAFQREWCTYLGGNKWDSVSNLVVDNDGNVLYSILTQSQDFYPITNPLQAQYGGGEWDGVLGKIDGQGSLVWSTYFGGKGSDKAYDMTSNSEGRIICNVEVGSTGLATDDADDKTLNGITDAMLLLLDEVDVTAVQDYNPSGLALKIFPNPVTDIVTIGGIDFKNFRTEILDISGKPVSAYVRKGNDFDVRNLGNGFYLIRLTDSDTGQQTVLRFVKY